MYHYKAKVERVVDGDTLYARVDVGFHASFLLSFRILGINAPEMKTPEGPAAKAWLAGLIEGETVELRTEKDDSFGRWLAHVTYEGRDIAQEMLALGLAVPYKRR